MGVDEVFNYVMETPENTNPNVLRSLLNNLDSGINLPDNPAQDGTYNLQNTVSSGTGTLSWASGGSSSGVLVVNVIPEGEGEGKVTMDKTWQEIYDAPFSVARVQTGQTGATLCQIYDIGQQDSEYYVSIIVPIAADGGVNFNSTKFHAESANDYPTTGGK